MTTLTLPIVIGKKYVRRDGTVVVAKDPHNSISADTVYVGEDDVATSHGGLHVWKQSGHVFNDFYSECDLVADYVEPAAAEIVCEGAQTAVAVAALDARIPAPAGHRHAANMLAYAQDAATHAEPWKLWEKRTEQDKQWIKLSTSPVWSLGHEYRRTPKCIVINGHEVPVPLRVEPASGLNVWMASPGNENYAFEFVWGHPSACRTWLKRGMVHIDGEAAVAHGRAMASFTETDKAA